MDQAAEINVQAALQPQINPQSPRQYNSINAEEEARFQEEGKNSLRLILDKLRGKTETSYYTDGYTAFNVIVENGIFNALDRQTPDARSVISVLAELICSKKITEIGAAVAIGFLSAWFYIPGGWKGGTLIAEHLGITMVSPLLEKACQWGFTIFGGGENAFLGTYGFVKLGDTLKNYFFPSEEAKYFNQFRGNVFFTRENMTDMVYSFGPSLVAYALSGQSVELNLAVAVSNFVPYWLGMSGFSMLPKTLTADEKAKKRVADYIDLEIRQLSKLDPDDLDTALDDIDAVMDEIQNEASKVQGKERAKKTFYGLLSLTERVKYKEQERERKKIKNEHKPAKSIPPLIKTENSSLSDFITNNNVHKIDDTDSAPPTSSTLIPDPKESSTHAFVRKSISTIAMVSSSGYAYASADAIGQSVSTLPTYASLPTEVAAGVLTLVPIAGLSYTSCQGVFSNRGSLAGIAYPKLLAAMKVVFGWIGGPFTGGTNYYVNWQYLHTSRFSDPVNMLLRYIAAAMGEMSAGITNGYYTIKLIETILEFFAEHCCPDERIRRLIHFVFEARRLEGAIRNMPQIAFDHLMIDILKERSESPSSFMFLQSQDETKVGEKLLNIIRSDQSLSSFEYQIFLDNLIKQDREKIDAQQNSIQIQINPEPSARVGETTPLMLQPNSNIEDIKPIPRAVRSDISDEDQYESLKEAMDQHAEHFYHPKFKIINLEPTSSNKRAFFNSTLRQRHRGGETSSRASMREELDTAHNSQTSFPTTLGNTSSDS